ncbi:hypothetical protein JHK82_051792 [Glycine max]|uniref:Uncharacterized protein n=2 Tax=Glycine subgen. Soja TaxID=1462606 RepID=K7MV45_SOYBN|nr:protein SOB FIVE-LIKE 4 isoform X2 [Glycine max]XP_028213359.1 uncharacterized protein LOC114395717 [Glycine soja]KAG4937560.1 hypothetical protein JHK85_052479 [Glycine max]KAG5093014.1 hypothetical protein JHK82_051792 [Glycine max]KAG5096078.1 hypothetical protein JHK84_051666 [Glycine max]KAH1156467.1 hypothetical protein GYH30_051320 [Glycine max]KAH1200213.1 hypothetical protein GmHk_18G053387 [Glycine max]|eukprot:XP_014625869.1 uncharacterized protein LOC100781125 [Glycine max]
MATAEVKKILFIDTSYDQRWQSQHSLCLIDAFHIILICIRNLPGSSLNLSPLVSTQCIYHFHFTFHNLLGPLPKLLAAQTDKQIYIKLSLSINEDAAGCSNENDGYHDNIYAENRRKKQGAKVDEEESDDSMASDASSGPIHYHHAYAHSQGSHGTAASKKDKQDHGSKCSSKKNANKQEKKRVDSRSKK